ncbi:MAG: response regulator transcription factor [Bacillus sp. (in: firmicutes)]
MTEYKVLVIDDEEDMRNLVEMYLLNAGYGCLQTDQSDVVLDIIETEKIDLVLLDIMMPMCDGFQLCEKIREKSDVPIIFLSAKGEEWDKVKALKLGGDDYVVKPFNPGELVARIEAILRRSHKGIKKSSDANQVKFKDILINKTARRVTVYDEIITLTLKEYELLNFLIEHENQVLSREQLLEHIWGNDYNGSLRTVDTHVKTLRMKLKKADYIQTVWGIGYKIEAVDEN